MSFYAEESWINWVDILSEQDYLIVDDFLSPDIYSELKSFFELKMEEDEFNKAAVGALYEREIIETIRGDFTFWLYKDRDLEVKNFFNIVDETIYTLNKYCYLSLSGFEFHFAFYPKNSFYKKHLDQFKNRSNRMISFIIYFNENWKKGDGGELRIYKNNQVKDIEPVSNRLVMFKSGELEHEVLKTNTGRKSITGWLLYKPSSLGYLLT